MDSKRAKDFWRAERYRILDIKKLELIRNELSKLNSVNSSYTGDIRVICEIRYGKLKKEIITIAKGGKHIAYKNKVFEPNYHLMDLLGIPKDERDSNWK